MSVEAQSVRADPLSRVFLWAGSPGTTATLVALVLALAGVGFLLPQELPADVLAETTSMSLSQVAVGLGLHHVLRAWPTQLLLVLLSLNLCAAALRRLFAPRSLAEVGSRAAVARGEAVQGPAAPVRLEDALRAVLPGWGVRRLGEGHAMARKGLTLEGVAVALLGLLVLGAAYVVASTSGTRGVVTLMVGDASDQAVHSRFQVQRQEGEALLSWTPVPRFELSCGPVDGGALLGDLTCFIETDKGRSQTTFRVGDDLEFEGFRLTLTGVSRLPGAASFDVDVDLAGERSTYEVNAGDIVDVERGGQRVATLMISGDTSQDPVGVVPADKVKREQLADLRVSARPRPMLTFRLATEEHVPWVWAGVTLVLLGLGLALGLPGYRLVAERGATGHVSLTLSGVGVLACPEKQLALVTKSLAAGTSQSS